MPDALAESSNSILTQTAPGRGPKLGWQARF